MVHNKLLYVFEVISQASFSNIFTSTLISTDYSEASGDEGSGATPIPIPGSLF